MSNLRKRFADKIKKEATMLTDIDFTIEELEDFKFKIEDCIKSLKQNAKLDETQMSFLKYHNLL